MKKYLLDSNIIINLWKKDEKTLNKLIKQNKLLILEEVLKELSVKEAKIYRSREVLSERFCELLPFALKINKTRYKWILLYFRLHNKRKI